MPRPINPATGRYHLVASPESLELWQDAAESEQLSLAQFIRRVCDAAAKKALRKAQSERRANGQKQSSR